MTNNLVAYSRAGDVFHYRWAARRCLRLIDPNTTLREIFIEGSNEVEKAGEYVIDVSEYSITNDDKKIIDYYQLKHTTVNQDQPFTLSDLEGTFTGFAERYLQHKKDTDSESSNISFTIITNRKIADSFKQNLAAIVNEDSVDKGFQKTIEKYTKLTSGDLVEFCNMISLEDGEGNYNVQKDELRIELNQLIAGSIDNAQIENLIALVQEKVLPDFDGRINREEVLKRFGITSERDLYPAPVIWDKVENVVERNQYSILKESISSSLYPVIVHAAGGVGKSIFCRQLIGTLPEGSYGIVYDCFGAGSYRRRSSLRHRHRHALLQIVNELASKGLCEPLIIQDTTLEEDIMRMFLLRLETSIKSLKKANDSAKLFILIDAADNAEMAAKEYNQSCFAHEILREKMPDDCKLVLLCRTERIYLLQPQSNVAQFELELFSEAETLENLKKWLPDAIEKDGHEFHRLTAKNPRVQANALYVRYSSIDELLSSLGPSGTTVDKQIELQLQSAIAKIKDQLPDEHHIHVNAICLGLASLPPHIPIEVLSKVAKVSSEQIKSFVSDIGRSLWLYDSSIQFRDEPTETWFSNTFLATKENYKDYINLLEPIANQLPYVAEVLPLLYLQSEQYDKLIKIALSDDYLPEGNPIDARNIRVYRLQFAFKAALKIKNYKDAVKLAMRAGEEVAGNQRQFAFFKTNIDLLISLQSKEKVQEIAFKRLLKSSWDGSENIYSASLLSGIEDYHGEARGYLRSSLNWLNICIEEQRKNEDPLSNEGVQNNDLLELAYAYLNIEGVNSCVEFLFHLKPKQFIFEIVQDLTRRLIDSGRFEETNEFLTYFIREPYYIIAIVSELAHVGKFPEIHELETCLGLMCSRKTRITRPNNSYNDQITPAIISFLEACLHRNLSAQKILRVLRYYIPIEANRLVYSSHKSKERTVYFKALAIRLVLSHESNVDIDAISPQNFKANGKGQNLQEDIKEFKEVVYILYPWYLLRAQILFDKNIKHIDVVESTNESSKKARTNRYRNYDTLPNEIAQVCASIMILNDHGTQEAITEFYGKFLKNDPAFTIHDKLSTLRAAYRTSMFESISRELELSIFEIVKSARDSGPDELAGLYIDLSRAVLNSSIDDASVYFNEAIKIASKFGDEITERWEAVSSLAKRFCDRQEVSDQFAYRFIRCAELVGEYVSREKHWNRSGAMSICSRMSPGLGIATLSRWRDRDIGRFEYQFQAVLNELVSSKIITSGVGWSLIRFFSYHQRNDFLSVCLENESSFHAQESILRDAIYLLQIEGTHNSNWHELKKIALKFNMQNESLDSIIDFYANDEEVTSTKNVTITHEVNDKWDDIFEGLSISTPDGFSDLIKRYKLKDEENRFRWQTRFLLKEAINRLDEKLLWDFIEVIFHSDDIVRYDFQECISLLPEAWKSKVSFKHKLADIVYRYGERYAHELTNDYYFKSFVKDLNLDKELIDKFISGILDGLADGDEFADASIFFGFVSLVSPLIDIQETDDLLDYSLSRFELHIDEDFGDGGWSDWLHTSEDINENIAGFIWSALGAPRSEVRWNAAHCVKKLAELNCTEIIEALINWMKHDKVGAFGCNKFPFYNLHARQYLLIAFVRVSVENSRLLNKYSDLFLSYAFSDHILIQKFASDIVLNIENSFPGTYKNEIITSIENIGKSSMPIHEEAYQYSTDSYWHKEGTTSVDMKFRFGWDFDRYWYEPLGAIFGVPGKQIEDLAANVIVNEWGVGDKKGYDKDPRGVLWNRSSQQQETWHDHGSYPRVDNLDFYLSYHSMLVVASRLIEKMPIIKTRNWSDEPWSDWLLTHSLTRTDGKWLADCRDAIPLNRPKWILQEKKDSWQTDISEIDFLDCLKLERNEELWINVKGGWREKDKERTESFSISSALVSTKTSDALLLALEASSDPYDIYLPCFDEEDSEIDSGIFKLKGWINERSVSKRIDKFDPYADEIDYPPFSLGNQIIEKFGLVSENDGKTWKVNNSSQDVLICETWSSHREDREEEPDQSGMRLKASLSFLKQVCATFEYDLIFEVSIKRDISYKYDRNKKYFEPKHKIFILSSDGKIRTADTNYQLG